MRKRDIGSQLSDRRNNHANGRYGVHGIYNLMHAPAMKAYLELCKKGLDASQHMITITDASSARCQPSVHINAANDTVMVRTATYN